MVGNVPHTAVGPGSRLLQEKNCIFLQLDSGSSTLHLSQISPLLFQTHPTSLYLLRAPAKAFSLMGHSCVTTLWTAVLALALVGDTGCCH